MNQWTGKPKGGTPTILLRSAMFLMCVISTLIVATTAQAQIPCRYEYVTWPNVDCGFGPFPGYPVAVNVHGHVCARWTSCGEPVAMTLLWTGGPTTQVLPIPQGYRAMDPADMNDLGEIVGTLELPMGTPGPLRAFMRRANGQVIDLGLPPGANMSTATAVNNSSEVVGFASTPNGNRAFLWKDGKFTYFNLPIGPHSQALSINENSWITGHMGNYPTSSSAFIWKDGETTTIAPLPDGTNAIGRVISSNGSVVGNSVIQVDKNVSVRSFFYQNGIQTDLGTLPGYLWTRAMACNDSVVVGRAEEGTEDPTAFIWADGQIRKLSDLVEVTNLVLPSTGVLNADGKIAIAGSIGIGGNWLGLVLTPVLQIGDATSDCRVNVNDLLLVINEWGKKKSPADVNHDGIVNVLDIYVVIENWSK